MITRENYEEFFLSYVDNELPVETRLAVEHFVAANPDLQEELETLLQCRLEPESGAVYPDKSSLLQYEESLLLYVDGELDDAGRKTVEELASREPRLSRELEQLGMAVSRPDTAIVFPDKESLYRPVKRRVVAMPWLRAVAAAAVAAVVVVLAWPRGHQAGVSAVALLKNISPVVTPAAVSPLHLKKDDAPRTNEPTRATAPKNDHPVYAAARGRDKGLTKVVPTRTPTPPAPAVAETNPADKTTPGPAHPINAVNAVTSERAVTSTEAAATSDQGTNSHPQKTAATSVAAVNIPKEQRSFATQDLLREAQEAGDGDMADNIPPSTGKTKLRGLFRRVSRAFGKTADRDDDGQRQMSISVFQVALK